MLDALSEFNGYITYLDKKIKAGYADETDDFSENGKASRKILRKDIEDTAIALIKFLSGAQFGGFIPGILTGSGGRIDERGNAEFESIPKLYHSKGTHREPTDGNGEQLCVYRIRTG